MNPQKIVAFLTLFLISLSVEADCNDKSCVQIKINRLIVQSEGDVLINTDGDASQLTCETDSHGYLMLARTAANFDAVYSLLLAAKMADKEIDRIRTNASGPCAILYVIYD